MQVQELIALLSTFQPQQEVLLEDLNGLHWVFTQALVREQEGELILGSKDVNAV